MIVKADLHLHSSASVDGCSSLDELISAAKKQGLSAIAVCDHDICTPVHPADGILMIPGVEIATDSGHILGLFLKTPVDPAVLSCLCPVENALRAIHAAGGLAVLAHPFAPQKCEEADLMQLGVDAIEVINARSALKKGANEQAMALANARHLPVTGSSDAHRAAEVGGAYTLFSVPELTHDALRAALMHAETNAELAFPCRWIHKGFSRLTKYHRENGLWGAIRTIPYLLACAARDLLKI